MQRMTAGIEKSLAPSTEKGDAIWLLRPWPAGIHRFQSLSTPAVVENRNRLNTYDISTNRGPIKAARSSQLKHRRTDLTGAHVDLSYTHEKLSPEDDAQEDDYLVDSILWHRPKPGSRDPDDIEFLVPSGKAMHHPKYDKWEPAESFLTVYNKCWRNYCRSHGLLPKVTKHLLAS